ncbi:GIY-YIG nuclease family protein [Vulcanococcus limneticus]|uniref:GIY-YIG nuclease family protein n=1 Tax=Vulcanococcus limneticus TaxID=2170428 RepID=UPI00398BD23C
MPNKRRRYPGDPASRSAPSRRVPLKGHTIYQHFWKNPDDKDAGLVWVGVRSEIARFFGFSGDSDIPLVSTTKSGRRVVTCMLNMHVAQASGRGWLAIYPDKTEYPFKASPLATRKIMAQIARRWGNPPLALKPPRSSAFKIDDILREVASHVYLVQLESFCKNKLGEAYYKIGKAKHIPRRIKQFGPCKVIASAAFSSESESLRAEAVIHQRYNMFRQPGTEIFCFTDDQVESVSKSLNDARDGIITLEELDSHISSDESIVSSMHRIQASTDQDIHARSRGQTLWEMYWKDPKATHKGCIWIMFDRTVGNLFGVTGDPDIPGMRKGLRVSAAKSRGKGWIAHHADGSKHPFKASPMATKKSMAQIASRWIYPPEKLQPSDGAPFGLHDLRDETCSYVYAVKLVTFSENTLDECYYKIGKSNQVPRRIKQFGLCELIVSLKVDTEKEALRKERMIHEMFSDFRCPDTEIFRLGKSRIKQLCEVFRGLEADRIA